MGHYRPQAMDDLVNIIGASSQAPAGLCTDSDEFASKETLGRDRSLIHARNRPQLTLEGSPPESFREFRRPRLSQHSIADAGDNRFRNAVL